MTLEEFNEWYRYDSATGLIFYKKKRVNSNRLDKPAGTINNCNYRILKFKGRMYTHHKLVWFIFTGAWPRYEIDHINGDTTDNRITNLRDVPKFLNLCNSHKHRAGKLPGCSLDKRRNKWKAKRVVNKVEYFLGYYSTEKEAHDAYINSIERIGYGTRYDGEGTYHS